MNYGQRVQIRKNSHKLAQHGLTRAIRANSQKSREKSFEKKNIFKNIKTRKKTEFERIARVKPCCASLYAL
jgi:dihydroorotate dehydrogenase